MDLRDLRPCTGLLHMAMPLRDPDGNSGRETRFGGQSLDARAPRFHKREFGRNEKFVRRQQRNGEEQTWQYGIHVPGVLFEKSPLN